MSAINVNSITGRTGGHGPVLTGVTTVSDGNLVVIGAGASIGIGTSAPARALEIMGTSARSPVLRFSDIDSALSNGESAGVIEFSQNDSFDPGAVNASIQCVGDGSTGNLAFDIYAGRNRQILRIEGNQVGVNTSGQIDNTINVAVAGTIKVQDSTDATQYLTINHQGINFQNTGAGSSTTATAHLLDDYEEGSWQPTCNFGGGTTGLVMGSSDGHYVKIGNQVTCACRVQITTKGTSTGDLNVEGLPFIAADNLSGTTVEGGGMLNYASNFTGSQTGAYGVVIVENRARFTIRYTVGATMTPTVEDTEVNDNVNFRATFSYFT